MKAAVQAAAQTNVIVDTEFFKVCPESCLPHLHTVVGSPYFMSPEICEAQPYGSKGDVPPAATGMPCAASSVPFDTDSLCEAERLFSMFYRRNNCHETVSHRIRKQNRRAVPTPDADVDSCLVLRRRWRDRFCRIGERVGQQRPLSVQAKLTICLFSICYDCYHIFWLKTVRPG